MIIYCITNKVNDKKYIGQTIRNKEHRWYEHCSGCYTQSQIIDRAIQKYRKENFKIDQIDTTTTIEELNKKEIYWIKELNTLHPNGYNLRTGGSTGSTFSDSVKKKLSNQKLGDRNPAKRLEVRQKISKTNRGRKHTLEEIDKIVQASIGRIFSLKRRHNISNSLKGRKLSEKHKENLRKNHRGTTGKTWTKTKKI